MPWNGPNSPYIANITPTKPTTAPKASAPVPTTQYSAPIGPGLDAQGNSTLPNTTQQNYNYTPRVQAPVVPQLSDAELVDADTAFQAQKAALASALKAYQADIDAQKSDYDTNYRDALRKLGFKGDVTGIENKTATAGEGDWNQTDVNTASGRGFESALNDFAARGMLQSSAYGQAYNNLLRNLNEQLSSSTTAKTKAFSDWERQKTNKATETTNAEAQARAESLARIKTQLGLA